MLLKAGGGVEVAESSPSDLLELDLEVVDLDLDLLETLEESG